MRPKLGGKKRFHKKKKRSAQSDFAIDEETGETGETAEFADEDESSWRSAPVRGIGIIVLSIVAGFSLASLVLQPWRDLATEAGVRGDMGEFPVPDISTAAMEPPPLEAVAPPDPPEAPAPDPAPVAVQVVKLPATRQPGNFNDPKVLWVHLHSYGGTTICDLARAHGEKVSPPKDNCNIMPDGCSTPKAFRIPCRKRAVSTQYTFSAVERVLDEDDLKCSGGSQNMIKMLVAALAEFKINILHLHLTDTASWPLEIEGYPEVAQKLSYRDINGKALTYSRGDIRELVEFARLRGVSILPEIDGPMHAPALAAALNLTVAATVKFSLPKFAYEPPPGTWNISSSNTLAFVRTALTQVEEDFTTAPFLHVGGDEPTAASLCALLEQPLRQQCWEQCSSTSAHGCAAVPKKPKGSNITWWFPEYLNQKVQDYFDGVIPSPAKIPRAAWSGAVTDMAVQLPPTKLKEKSVLQLWTFPSSDSTSPAISEEDCNKYDLIQSAATYPQDNSNYGWLYMDCGSGANWISMGPDYWCARASWAALYSLNSTQGYGSALKTHRCQKAFLGAEMALWSEIGGMGNGMALIFPRAAAFAERMWSNPAALRVEDMTGGTPPGHYWQSHLKDALSRLNEVVANFDLLHLGVSHLQPEFCRVHPEYCNEYTSGIYEA